MRKRRFPILVETSSHRTPTGVFAAPEDEPAAVALKLRERGWQPYRVRLDESIPWQTTKIFYGGKRRKVRYKEVTGVYWQRGAKQRPLRLIVIAPTPYRKSKSKKLYYRDPAGGWRPVPQRRFAPR